MAPFVQGACCTVISAKRKSDEQALSIKVSLKKPNLFFTILLERFRARGYLLFWRKKCEGRALKQAEILQACDY